MPGKPNEQPRGTRLTARGALTRNRIVHAAADLMYAQGVAATTLDQVMAASGTSKSQLYHYFSDKEALVDAVIARQASEVLDRQRQRLTRLGSLRGLERWRDAMVQRSRIRRGAHGCELGSLASELADRDDDVRSALSGHFEQWKSLLADGFERMRRTGVLREDADPAELATGVMAALQGGYLLAQTARNARPMEIALDMAIAHVRSFRAS